MQQEHSTGSPGFLPVQIGNGPITMSSREIAELVDSRHDKVKQSIDRLVARGVIVQPPLGDEQFIDSLGRPRAEQVYRIGKRDSYVIVAQLSPEFTARLVDRWQELEAGTAQLPTTAQAFANVFQMVADAERRQAEQDRKITAISADIELIKDTAPLKAKPQNTESVTEVRERMNKRYGLPPRISDIVLNGLPYSPRVFAMVKNSHEDAKGSSFAVWRIIDVTKLFKLFVGECQMVTATQATHPHIEGRFKLTGKAGA